ncbi:GtrA family protein [Mongoliimonas terrestris]|uniref:GtrA family protein n=1 Tax=Mongoliimonas terrestris TaxID=1709001 RepID=UPI0009495494|nr:GtrA family protein [Mongoliimonas terrestris]
MRDLLARLVGYVATGGLAAIVDVGGFALLVRAGMAVTPAAVLSFAVAMGVNYVLTSRLVFSHRLSTRRLLLFVLVALVGLTVNVSVTTVAATAMALPPVLAKIAGVGVAFLLNFFMNALIVFRGSPTR